MPSIDTWTIRKSATGSPSIVRYRRDATNVSVACGLLHGMPAGMFQPSSIVPEAQDAHVDLWRNIMREYSEEFLGQADRLRTPPSHSGRSAQLAATAEFASTASA